MLLLRLRLRTWLFGWGLHPEELRVLSGYRRRAFRAYAVMVLVLFAAIFVVIPGLQGYTTPVNIRVREGIGLLVILLLLAIYLAVPALIYRRRAREATLVPEHLLGYCYRVAFNPPSPCFIRFGVSAETAHWYAVPPVWEELISTASPDTPFELWVLLTTGWVERLRRGGSEPEQVTQPAPEQRLAGDVEAGAEEYAEPDADEDADAPDDEGATKAEARAMKRYARRAGMIWHETPQQIARSWLWLLLSGLFFTIGVAVFCLWLVASYAGGQHADEQPLIAIVLGLFALPGLTLIACGIPSFAAWLRERRLDDTQAQMTGEVVAWMRYRNWYVPASFSHQDQRREKLVKIRTADGGEQIFRLPPKLAHRIEDRGDLVRITYRAATGEVLDVRHVAAPVEALAADHGDV